MGVLHHIAESTIHSEDASREFSVNERSSVLHFYFAGAETIAPFGHSGRSRCIGNQHRSIGSLGFQKELHHRDRKSTRLNSSHGYISYAVFCLKKKKKIDTNLTTDHRQASKVSRRASASSGGLESIQLFITKHRGRLYVLQSIDVDHSCYMHGF